MKRDIRDFLGGFAWGAVWLAAYVLTAGVENLTHGPVIIIVAVAFVFARAFSGPNAKSEADRRAVLIDPLRVNHKLAVALGEMTKERDEARDMAQKQREHALQHRTRAEAKTDERDAMRRERDDARALHENSHSSMVTHRKALGVVREENTTLHADLDRATRDADALYELLDCVLHDALESNPHWLLPETVDMVVRACGLTEEEVSDV